MSFIMNNDNEIRVAVKAADYDTCEDVFNKLMLNMEDLIARCDANEEEKMKLRKDIYTDVVIPDLKELYQDAINYILWNRIPRRNSRPLHTNYHSYTRIERDYGDEEETEDED